MIITKNKINRFVAVLLCAVTLLLWGAALPSFASSQPDTPYTEHAVVYNIDSGTLMYEEAADVEVYPAGTVKIMTALLTLEHFKDTSAEITVTPEMIEGIQGNTAGFDEGEVLTVEQLLAALIISNSNDAANILACAVAGNTGAFLDAMNARAEELGMTSTEYMNVTGIHHSRMKTSARDVLTVTVEAAKYQLYENLASSAVYTLPATNTAKERTLRNRNYFVSTFYNLNYYRESVSGLSCSYTAEAGTCLSLVGTNSDGLRFIAVVMGANVPEEPEEGVIYACEDALGLLSWAYRSYKYFTVVGTGDMICEIPVSLSSSVDHVIALPAEKITAFLPSDTDLTSALRTEYTLNDQSLVAPVSKGQVIGSLTAFVDDREVGRVDLIAKNNVDRSMWLSLRERIVAFFTHPLVILLIAAALIFILLVVVLVAIRIAKTNNKVKYKRK